MKTSILVSGTAALCLLLTFAEVPNRNSAENSHTMLVNSFTYAPSNLVYTVTSENFPARTSYTEPKTNVKAAEDLSYIKFNAADYLNNTEMATEVTSESSLDYLKFKVSENTEFTAGEAIELPADECANLKFDVTEYTENTELISFDAIELPVDNFNYLKFDVNKYVDNDEITSDNITELPVDESSYLKFDVNKCNSQSNLDSDNLGEMPLN